MVYESIRYIIADQLNINVNTISMKSSIKNDLGADSLDFLDILMNIEEAFSTAKMDINIPNKKMTGTVGEIVEYVEQKIGYNTIAEKIPA